MVRLSALSEPEGIALLAASSAWRMSAAVSLNAASRSGSSSTRIARPGPPIVVTSRVPGTRFSSASSAWATRSTSKAPRSLSSVHSVSVTIGTSSMPLGFTRGSPTPSSLGSQSRFALTVSWRRTRASVRGTPTLNCAVTMAKPGFETEKTCSSPWI